MRLAPLQLQLSPAGGAHVIALACAGPREIRTDHWVRTADGAIGRVRYVHGAHATADVAIDNELEQTLTLPIAELRRISNPKNKRPRVEGVPAERPRCAWCDTPLRPDVDNKYSDHAKLWERVVVRRVFVGWKAYEGVFHNQACAIAFAGASYRGGFRRRR